MEETETLHTSGKISGNIRKILGLPSKNKKLKTYTKKPAVQRKQSIKLNQKTLTPFERGLTLAAMATSTWNSQFNSSQVYIFNRRVHHGEAGVLVGLYGLYKNDLELFGIGLGLALDDVNDINDWFTFKQRSFSDSYYPSVKHNGGSFNNVY